MSYWLYILALTLAAGIIEHSFAKQEEMIRLEAQQKASDRHAVIYGIVARCLNEKSTITVNGLAASECKPVKERK